MEQSSLLSAVDQQPEKPSLPVGLNLDLFRKPEVIQPYLHKLDERALISSLHGYFKNDQVITDIVLNFCEGKNIHAHADRIVSEITKAFTDELVPNYFIYDLFNFYYYHLDRIDFKEPAQDNMMTYKLLENLNNPIMKILTNDSLLKSMVMIRSLLLQLLFSYAVRKLENDPKADELFQQLRQPGIGISLPGTGIPSEADQPGQSPPDGSASPQPSAQGDDPSGSTSSDPGGPMPFGSSMDSSPVGNSDQEGDMGFLGPGINIAGPQQSFNQSNLGQIEQLLNDMVSRTLGRYDVMEFGQQQVDKAKETIEAIEDMINTDDANEVWTAFESGSPDQIEKALETIDKNYLENLRAELQDVRMNMSSVKKKLKALLDKSINYFSVKEEPVQVSLLDAETLDELQNVELLHPRLRTLFLDDVMAKESKKIGKIDVYVDVSSSMDHECGAENSNGDEITKGQFAKALLLQIYELGLLDDLYVFNDALFKKENSLPAILTIKIQGNTDINRVVKNIKKTGKNSLIITDAQDDCNCYDPKAYFLGVKGACYSSFTDEVRALYAANNQWCIFDGQEILSVDIEGNPVE